MFEAMAAARDHISLETYILDGGEIGERLAGLLAKKIDEGVKVNLIYDGVGSIGTPAAYFDRLRASGVAVCEFNPVSDVQRVNNRDHRKILVVDGRVAFTGGINISEAYSMGSARARRTPQKETKVGWRDTQVRVEGPAVRGLQRAFQENWSEITGEALVGPEFFPELPPVGSASAVVVPSSPLAAQSGAGRVYAVTLSAAAKEIWVGNSYFLPDEESTALMVAAVKRGVDVRVIVPSDQHNDVPATKAAGRSSFGPLLQGGVRMFEYAPTMFHPKTIVVDGIFSTVGSANFDDRSFHLNEEINVFVYDTAFAAQMREQYLRDLAKCNEYTLAMWNQRPLKKRITEWFAKPLRSEL